MKKLVLLFATIVLTVFNSVVLAQSTGTAPAPGATHSYFITPGDGANTIAWSVTKGDLTTTTTDATISASSSATTDITWANTVAVGDWYYVHVVETDGTCTNEKVLPVQITESDFTLTLAAANATQCYDGAVVVNLVNPSTVNYDHGTATLEFTVTPGVSLASSSYTGYEFDLSLTVPGGFASDTTFSANVSSFDGTTVTVSDNSAVTITFEIDNENTYDNSSAANAQDFTATVEISNGVTVNGVSENDSDGDNTDETEVSRPNTSGIGTN